MGQFTIYLDDETENTARVAAEADGISLSKWIAQRIQKSARAECRWPCANSPERGRDLPDAEQFAAVREKGRGTSALLAMTFVFDTDTVIDFFRGRAR